MVDGCCCCCCGGDCGGDGGDDDDVNSPLFVYEMRIVMYVLHWNLD